ncbi:MAG: hypothetical protein N0C84_07845 [Candidatus Thiodiazotropha taylori]|uniref:Uncharacterized protein n=1 Tax=Candidatus Thiodiazotropha taylori TaxID=2792791 RepID=A0A9E4KCA3_9GAMM|nr:hypothetical protein [Candidatus Thiodiazotropha taylori]MCW4256364.1 hypothetical protein [Candidatus Thiodiazotropha taylori]
MLSRNWSREAFEGFCSELVNRVGAKLAALRLERYALFFAKLDAACANPTELSADLLIGLFGNEGLRRQAVPYGYLLRTGLAPQETEVRRELMIEESRQQSILNRAQGHWYLDLLNRYQRHLSEISGRYQDRGWNDEKRRFGPRTITANLRASELFLGHLETIHGVDEIQRIDQVHLNRFILDNPGYRESIRAFVRFLNRKVKLFRKVRVETVTRALPEGLFLERTRYQDLLGNWLRAGKKDRKEALIGLFMLLYAQSIKKVVRLRVSDMLKGIDGTYRISFGRAEIALDKRVSELLERYLKERRALATMEDDWENAYLFPGRRYGGHLSEAAISNQLKKRELSAEQLFASALYYAYLSGMRHPKVLVRAFGITDYTAIKYLNLINPRLTAETNMRTVRNG